MQGEAGINFGVGGFYQIDPDGLFLSTPSTISISYDDSEIVGFDESELSVYRWDENTGKWELVGGVVDIDNNTVTATINRLGTFTLAPKITYSDFDLIPEAESIPADGSSVLTIVSNSILYNDGTVVNNGTLITISAEKGTLLAVDADDIKEGIQIETIGGKISFEIQSGFVAGDVSLYASSVDGDAHGSCNINFTDVSAPGKPVITEVTSRDESLIIRWDSPSDLDIAGFILYYDTDSSAPYEGQSSIYGLPSPIDVGPVNSWQLTGLETTSLILSR